MATNDDFDLASLFQGPGAVLSGVLGVADNARKTVGGVMETIASLQRAAVAVEQLVSRMNRLVDDLEMPMRALTPELEKSVARMQRLSSALEGPIDRLIPGLESAVATFDRVALSQLPESLDEARQQLQSLLELFGEIPRRLGQLGARNPLAALLPLGSFGSFGVTRENKKPEASRASEPQMASVSKGPARRAESPKKSVANRSTVQKSAVKKSAVKKAVAQKSATTKSIPKKSVAKKSATKKSLSR